MFGASAWNKCTTQGNIIYICTHITSILCRLYLFIPANRFSNSTDILQPVLRCFPSTRQLFYSRTCSENRSSVFAPQAVLFNVYKHALTTLLFCIYHFVYSFLWLICPAFASRLLWFTYCVGKIFYTIIVLKTLEQLFHWCL